MPHGVYLLFFYCFATKRSTRVHQANRATYTMEIGIFHTKSLLYAQNKQQKLCH